MGNRSVITIKSDSLPYPIHFYGHWSGTDNLAAVQAVLSSGNARIGDASYLAAQIFSSFALEFGGYDGNLGFGIDTGEFDEEWLDNPTVYVDADNGDYTYQDITYDRFGETK